MDFVVIIIMSGFSNSALNQKKILMIDLVVANREDYYS